MNKWTRKRREKFTTHTWKKIGKKVNLIEVLFIFSSKFYEACTNTHAHICCTLTKWNGCAKWIFGWKLKNILRFAVCILGGIAVVQKNITWAIANFYQAPWYSLYSRLHSYLYSRSICRCLYVFLIFTHTHTHIYSLRFLLFTVCHFTVCCHWMPPKVNQIEIFVLNETVHEA